MKKTPAKVSFKAYEQHQSQLFPSSLDEWIPQNHLVRLINTVIDKMELDSVLNSYPVEEPPAIIEQIPFRWLSGGNC